MQFSLPASVQTAFSIRKLTAVTALSLFAAATPLATAANAKTPAPASKHSHLHVIAHAFVNATLPGAGLLPDYDDELPTEGVRYELKLVHAHTDEAIDVIYRIGDTYIPEALEKLNSFLRDSHNQEINAYDPRTFDVLHTMLARLGKPDTSIDILSAYRSKETNDELRASGATNAAEHSQHIDAKAVDLRVEGVPTTRLRDAARSLDAGGVGYYPSAQFIHVDVGPVRQWTYVHHASSHRRSTHRKHKA